MESKTIKIGHACSVEFIHPCVAGAQFTPIDSDGSPGSTTVSGRMTEDANHQVTKQGGKASKISQFR